jgi:hypothetical protein
MLLHQWFYMYGTHMQVMSEEEGLRGGWFSAKVLTLTETEALVVYDELLTDDGHLSLSFSLSVFCHCSQSCNLNLVCHMVARAKMFSFLCLVAVLMCG